ncbi:MAG: prolyl oligopeptidase family serine peptidase [Acidobacteriota bacterium]
MYEYDPFSDRYQEIPLNWPNGLGGTYGKVFDATGDLIATTLAKGVINPFVIIKKPEGSKEWQITKIDHPMASNFHTYSISKDGKGIVFIYSTASELPQIYYGKIDDSMIKEVKKITEVNKHLKNKFIAKREIIKWKSDKGREIEGILFYPKDYKEGEKYPLILNIHGGPAAYDPDHFTLSWGDYPHILAGKGSFVLFVNYSGSSNYGLEFVESIYGKYYELEVPDLLNGVKYLIKKGMVDPEKLGTMGWSNGAILSIALTVESDVFKVALCGAGDVNWVSDYGNCAFGPQFDNLYLKGPYWEDVDYYIKKSPLFRMNKVKTPTLILFGDKDTNVPTQQGWEHYRALQQIGKVPVKFVLFPGEPHGLMRISHQRRKMEEELEWLDKYLFKKEEKEIKSFKKGSPLDLTLKKSAYKKDEKGYLGIFQNGILIPETVKMGDIELGRFEVTRAQFSEFLKGNKDIDTKNLVGFIDGKFKEGTENYPVSGVDFDGAVKYCEWLSLKTGKKFRLPEEKEMKKWLDTCKGEENTLCYWAGYDLTIDEAEELETKFKELEQAKTLIMEAGSMSPSTGEIYDLNGNVSEWCIKDGKESSEEKKGIVLGLSSRNISDKRQPFKTPPGSYVGFRVVLVK